MLSITGILVIAAVIIVIDVPPLWRKKLIKELWVFSFFLLLATVLGIAQALNFKTPNPLNLMIAVYKPVADIVNIWLK